MACRLIIIAVNVVIKFKLNSFKENLTQPVSRNLCAHAERTLCVRFARSSTLRDQLRRILQPCAKSEKTRRFPGVPGRDSKVSMTLMARHDTAKLVSRLFLSLSLGFSFRSTGVTVDYTVADITGGVEIISPINGHSRPVFAPRHRIAIKIDMASR